MEKRRNCSWGAISPLFHNIFNISLTSRVQLHIFLLNVVNRISFSSILQIWYVEVRISRSILESPLEFEITRVDCIHPIREHFKERSAEDFIGGRGAYLMIPMRFVSDFYYKNICCWYSFELPRLVEAIQMSNNNTCFYKDSRQKYTGCNLKTKKLLDYALIGLCALIWSCTVTFYYLISDINRWSTPGIDQVLTSFVKFYQI